MDLTDDELTRSHYGSLDPTPLNCSNQTATPQAQQVAVASPEPPKPAVRRTHRLVNIATPNDPPLTSGADKANALDRTSELIEEIRRVHRGQRRPKQEPELSELETSIEVVQERTNMKNSVSLPLASKPSDHPTGRTYPKQVFFIVANEFCERFSYYGLQAVLVLYLSSALGFTDKNATVCYHLFVALCYTTPILGAILGDSIWGKFKTIFYLSLVYLLGELVLTASSVFWSYANLSVAFAVVGLVFIGIGTGGIKPCVSALGGDQFFPHEHKWRESFFSLFYATINLGSLISMFVTPILRSQYQCVGRTDCFPYAFGLPSLLMFVGVVCFLVAKNSYKQEPLPEKNVIVAFGQCVWLALKRKLSGHKLDQIKLAQMSRLSDYTSSSSLSSSSNEDVSKSVISHQVSKEPGKASRRKDLPPPPPDHWLYLAADQFDRQSIEDFRSVLMMLVLSIPLPVYWCLYGQQGSLWTLQATRMDGHVFNTDYELQPDQITVLNPLLMLTFIPIFEVIIYPGLARCNLLTRPISRMATGGFLLAFAFVLSAMIEVSILHHRPAELPAVGRANLLLVNGIGNCRIVDPEISYIQVPGTEAQLLEAINKTTNSIGPLGALSLDLLASSSAPLNNYKLKFKLADNLNADVSKNTEGCPFNHEQVIEHNFGPFADRAVRLVYLEQGNGKVTIKIFNESLALPPTGKARVRLLYESFGSLALSEKRKFALIRQSSGSSQSSNDSMASSLQILPAARDGQVILGDYIDVPVTTKGDLFTLQTNDNLLGYQLSKHPFLLKQGTRNLIVVQQKNSTSVEAKLELLQDNTYRINMLYQLAPYVVLSASEVMMSITGLHFSYSMAPENMKSLLLALWSSVVAFGNILTVAIEAMHFFPSVAHDFLFYAMLMAVDSVLLAILGYYFKPYKGRTVTIK